MANAERGEVAVKIGGRDLTLVYTYNAVAELEQLEDAPFVALVSRLANGTALAFRLMLWGALRKYHPEHSLADVGDALDDLTPEEFMAVGEAVGKAARFRLSKLGYVFPDEQPASAN